MKKNCDCRPRRHGDTENSKSIALLFSVSPCLCGGSRKIFKNEYGHTLIEAMVAMALFAAVVVPVGRIFTTMVMTGGSGNKVTALMLGKSALEECLAARDYTGTEKEVTVNGKMWLVKRGVRNDGLLKVVTVDVFRKGRTHALVSLKTARTEL